jgi:hypothetical protein
VLEGNDQSHTYNGWGIVGIVLQSLVLVVCCKPFPPMSPAFFLILVIASAHVCCLSESLTLFGQVVRHGK